MVWQHGMRKYTKNLTKVDASRLLGRDPKDPWKSWLETLEDVSVSCVVLSFVESEQLEFRLCTAKLYSMCLLLHHSFLFILP